MSKRSKDFEHISQGDALHLALLSEEALRALNRIRDSLDAGEDPEDAKEIALAAIDEIDTSLWKVAGRRVRRYLQKRKRREP
ncbi:MAG TPA: hypothetical protein VFF73_09980 [Planctomycetota bacterium]|nr:hypothetical protein [Planctomycetota bacterium]